MSRSVKVNTGDRIIRVFGEYTGKTSVYVHRHLLFGRQSQNGSESKLEFLVREAENKTGPDRNAIKLPELGLVSLEKYSASLYGEPMWDQTLEKCIIEDIGDIDDLEVETRSLVEIQ
ncbi:hypothetical protein Q7P37_001083 [Cladosporium fusiforme]